MLNSNVGDIKRDQLPSAYQLARRTGGDAATLVSTEHDAVVDVGNTGIASRGDVLSSNIGGLLAHKLSLYDVTRAGYVAMAPTANHLLMESGTRD